MAETPAVRIPQNDPREATNDLITVLSQKVVGQPEAMSVIVPYLDMYFAELSPQGRPAGIFLLLGPTGTGKTRTVEALAEVLHGSAAKVLKINCGEFQMEHEVAKLIGAPPGYVGHRESQPMLTQARLDGVVSEKCNLSLVLFDEIEKAAPTLTRLLLGVLDRAILQLGDNTTVNFERSFVFLTSNLGARKMMEAMHPGLGFQTSVEHEHSDIGPKLKGIALAAVRKMFSPEFVNRLDAIITYQPLDTESFARILDQHIAELQEHVNTRLGARCFQIEVTPESREFLLRHGTSEEFGARELKRTVHRHLTQPLATLVARGHIEAGSRVCVEFTAGEESLALRTGPGTGVAYVPAPQTAQQPRVLIVDDNHDLLGFLEQHLARAGWKMLAAETVRQARQLVTSGMPQAALLDYLLPDGNGVELALQLRRENPRMHVIIMTGGLLSLEEEHLCRELDFPVLRKPFLTSDVMQLLRSRLAPSSSARA